MRIGDWSSDVCSFRSTLAARSALLNPCSIGGGTAAQAIEKGRKMPGERQVQLRHRNFHAQRGHAGHRIFGQAARHDARSEEHTSELQSLMRISYAVFCLKKKNNNKSKTSKISTPHNPTTTIVN